QAPALVGDRLQDRRQEQLFDGDDLRRNDAQHQPDGAALLEDVDAEAPQSGNRIGQVDLEVILEFLLLPAAHDAEGHGDGVFLGQAGQLAQGGQAAIDPDHGEAADLQVEVRGPSFRGDLQEVVDVHQVPP